MAHATFKSRFTALAVPLALPLVVLTACAACDTGLGSSGPAKKGDPQSLRVVSWNVQALFDDTDTGTEYAEYRTSAGWNSAAYQERLKTLGAALLSFPDGGADIIALEEVENARILQDLAQTALAHRGYGWSAFANLPGGSLGVGILSRYPINSALTHSISSYGQTIPRPILEANIDIDGAPLTLFVCHWKSKLGSAETTEPLRRAASRVIRQRLGTLGQNSPGLSVLVAGDLNENTNEFERQGGLTITALMPDSPDAEALVQGTLGPRIGADQGSPTDGLGEPDFVVVTDLQPPRSSWTPPRATFFDPWLKGLWKGSYAYQNAWEQIDHILCPESLFDGQSWEYASFAVADGAPFAGESSYPQIFNPKTLKGLSDHLPVMVTLERKASQK